MNKLYTFLLASALLYTIIGCQKKASRQPVAYTVSQEMQDYFNWKVGSYWVFTDSLTGKRDSLVVNEKENVQGTTSDNNPYTDISTYIYEYYDTSAPKKDWEIFLPSRGSEASLIYYNQGNFSQGDGGQVITYDINPFKIAAANTILSQINLGPKSYTNVLSSALGNDRILLNADSGFVKMTLNNQYTQKVLLLQKSHIVH